MTEEEWRGGTDIITPTSFLPRDAETLAQLTSSGPSEHASCESITTWCFPVGDRTALSRCPVTYGEAPSTMEGEWSGGNDKRHYHQAIPLI
eukprot:gene14104-biopygen3836